MFSSGSPPAVGELYSHRALSCLGLLTVWTSKIPNGLRKKTGKTGKFKKPVKTSKIVERLNFLEIGLQLKLK